MVAPGANGSEVRTHKRRRPGTVRPGRRVVRRLAVRAGWASRGRFRVEQDRLVAGAGVAGEGLVARAGGGPGSAGSSGVADRVAGSVANYLDFSATKPTTLISQRQRIHQHTELAHKCVWTRTRSLPGFES